jgi:hypothetical protein
MHFGESIYIGTKLVLTNRRFICTPHILQHGYRISDLSVHRALPLLVCLTLYGWRFFASLIYSPFSSALALYLHRFLENALAPAFAKRVLGISAWSQIIVGGSNLGEVRAFVYFAFGTSHFLIAFPNPQLFGAATVFILSDYVTTPIPWLRFDAVALNIVWVLPYYAKRAKKNVSWAWRLAATFLPISYGWAAGDVSLAAYIQASLSENDFGYSGVSALGAVMVSLPAF